jgi:hypothetical protein
VLLVDLSTMHIRPKKERQPWVGTIRGSACGNPAEKLLQTDIQLPHMLVGPGICAVSLRCKMDFTRSDGNE